MKLQGWWKAGTEIVEENGHVRSGHECVTELQSELVEETRSSARGAGAMGQPSAEGSPNRSLGPDRSQHGSEG